MSKLLFETNDWTFPLISKVDEAISNIAMPELKLDIYPNQIEIIGSDQMLDAYSSVGLPIMYNHWSFGKRFVRESFEYRKGLRGLAYEIVINSSPCISYLMEENSMTMQTLVIAHAAYGHNHFFKNNYLFREWTDAEGILDYLQFAKNYINQCEEKYGRKKVEWTLDACHALQHYGVDRYKRPRKLNRREEEERQKEREDYVQQQANVLWSTLPKNKKRKLKLKVDETFPSEPQENILYFLEKYSPSLEPWQREIIRIVRKISQYFYPQMQTKLMNEGWASFVHYYVMNRLWNEEMISDGSYLEFIHSHSSVLTQRDYNHKHYSGFNPYALGFEMFSEIRRVCENPTEEDREYFPHLMGQNWVDVCIDAVKNYRDESFVAQFLTPNTVRKWRLFEITNVSDDPYYIISNIQNRECFNNVRTTLSRDYSIGSMFPDIQIVNSNLKTDRTLELQYTPRNHIKLHNDYHKVVEHIKYLWGYNVVLRELGTGILSE